MAHTFGCVGSGQWGSCLLLDDHNAHPRLSCGHCAPARGTAALTTVRLFVVLRLQMLVLDGRKAWTIFPRGATPLLRPSFAHGHDASFAEDVNAAEDATPGCSTSSSTADWRRLERWACELTSGELLFVPAGCAHAVSNLTATAAISANFVSQSNRQLAIDELSVAGLQAPAAADLARHLAGSSAGGGSPSSNCLEQDVPWESFKQERPSGRV